MAQAYTLRFLLALMAADQQLRIERTYSTNSNTAVCLDILSLVKIDVDPTICAVAAGLCLCLAAVLPQTALSSRSTSSRMRVWSLINNVSIADNGAMQCFWPDGNVTYPTQLLGAVVHTYGPGARVHTQGAVASPLSPEAIVLGHADAASTSRSSANSTASARGVAGSQFDAGSPDVAAFGEDFALSFGYKPSLFQLPVDAQDKFLHIQNVTLLQLPQMSPGRKLLRGFRRLLSVDSSADAGIWTVLLWPVRRWVGLLFTVLAAQLKVLALHSIVSRMQCLVFAFLLCTSSS
jgi:hypothetical protein